MFAAKLMRLTSRTLTRTFCVAAVLAPMFLGAASFAQDQEKRIVIIEDADYYGADLETVKDVDLDACKTSCLGNDVCRAFTYNVSARWCFLKSSAGPLNAFNGAVAGRVVTVKDAPVKTQDAREKELSFLPASYLMEARSQKQRLPRIYNPAGRSAAVLEQDGRRALESSNLDQAENAFGGAIVLEPASFELWAGLSSALLRQSPDDWQKRQDVYERSTASAVNAYLRAVTDRQRARALNFLGDSLARRDAWKLAIRSLHDGLQLVELPDVRARYDQMVAEHGFRILDQQVDSDAASPRVCIVFSDVLPRDVDLNSYIKVTGAGPFSIEAENAQACVDGVKHGERYGLLVREGLPSRDGETLLKSADLTVYVRDRAPSAHFLGRAYVLPKGKGASVPVVSVNTDEVELEIYRIGERGLASSLRDQRFLSQLNAYKAEQIRNEFGEEVWKGVVETQRQLNRDVTTAIPMDDVALDMSPGVYAMVARPKGDIKNQWGAWSTQWFIVSDLGLSAYSGNDGVVASVRSLASAQAISGVKFKLIAVNNEILGEAVSDLKGMARFAAGLARGVGGRAPALLAAETALGDFAFLDLSAPAFDLTDRGVDGRPAPQPIDVFAWTERGVYRPGETVHAAALARDDKADALPSLPMTFVFDRPDGVEHSRVVVSDAGAGGYAYSLDLASSAQTGTWSLRIYADPKGPALATKIFLVEDFQPERVDFKLETISKAFSPLAPPEVTLDAKFLYGAPAGDLRLEGEVNVAASRTMEAYPGYQFGLDDEETTGARATLPGGLKTADDGALSFTPVLPDLQPITGLYEAEIVTRLVETGGRFVERSLSLPVLPTGERIGVKSAFEGGVDEGGPADFQIIVVNPSGERVAAKDLRWTLSKIETRYQWYRANGNWSFEPVTTSKRVANGDLTVAADSPAKLSLPVEWGEYRLEVSGSGEMSAVTSSTFTAGWYVASASSQTPDILEIGLDKASYRAGETAKLRLKPRFDGVAVVNVMAERLISTMTVPVKKGEEQIDLPVSADWGTGVYVTATLYRPMDIAAARMPSRSIGLQWVAIDPQDRKLAVELSAPEKILPGSALKVPLRLTNLKAGEKAYVTVAAVDVGILNLTRYQAPNPDAWYFGQRRLGMELRDLYGQLIDRTAGTRGAIRSGGDMMALRLDSPPPQEASLASFSGVVEVDDNGAAEVSFDIPDFNGTVRLMAVAWSKEGVGHGEQDVIVRAPVVMSASLPRFLAPGDQSVLLVDVDNVDGPAGEYALDIATSGPVSLTEPGSLEVTLDEKQRKTLRLAIKAGTEAGDGEFSLVLTGPQDVKVAKALALGVRDLQPEVTRRSFVTLPKGGSLTLDEGVLSGLRLAGAQVSVGAGGAARINVGGLLSALDRYPYGCVEQTASRALPLLYLNEVAQASGLGSDGEIRERVAQAIARVLSNQNSSGSFGMWSSFGETDLWLDSYVTDFLIRAREKGYQVEQTAFDMALDNLENRIAYASDFSSGGEGIAYGLYVLARSGRVSVGDLRYYVDVKLQSFNTPLAKAQLAAALALYGENARAKKAFEAASLALLSGDDPRGGREDYGSLLRDGAGVLAYVAASKLDGVEQSALTRFVAGRQDDAQRLSTQDMAWLLMAARQLVLESASDRFSLNGNEREGLFSQSVTGADLAKGNVVIVNEGDAPADVVTTVSGRPVTPPPAGGKGYRIEREYYDMNGDKLDTATVAQNTRMVVVLTVVPEEGQTSGRLLLVDRLPAGVVIDNPRLVRSGDLGAFQWLKPIDNADHVAFRDDRFVVAADLERLDGDRFTFAYLARAATPGAYAHPPATVEDMYRPDLTANTDTGRMEVLGPGR